MGGVLHTRTTCIHAHTHTMLSHTTRVDPSTRGVPSTWRACVSGALCVLGPPLVDGPTQVVRASMVCMHECMSCDCVYVYMRVCVYVYGCVWMYVCVDVPVPALQDIVFKLCEILQ